MQANDLNWDDTLDDFVQRTLTFDGVSKRVHVSRPSPSAPAVIVMAEMPGISPEVARFARWVREAGFSVYIPSLFGVDGAVPQADEGAAVFCRAQRFAAYAQALGSRFVGRVLPDSAANPQPSPFFAQHVKSPHSVVTAHLIDAAGEPALAARDEILAFFRQRLAAPPTADSPSAAR